MRRIKRELEHLRNYESMLLNPPVPMAGEKKKPVKLVQIPHKKLLPNSVATGLVSKVY